MNQMKIKTLARVTFGKLKRTKHLLKNVTAILIFHVYVKKAPSRKKHMIKVDGTMSRYRHGRQKGEHGGSHGPHEF